MADTRLLDREPVRGLFEADKIADGFEWVDWLTPRNARIFFGEVYAAAISGASAEVLQKLLSEWQATAELEASPEILAQIDRNKERRFLTEDEWRAERRRTA